MDPDIIFQTIKNCFHIIPLPNVISSLSTMKHWLTNSNKMLIALPVDAICMLMQSSSIDLPEATQTPIPPPKQFKADKSRGQDMDTDLDAVLELDEVPTGFDSDQTPAAVAAPSPSTQIQVKHTRTKKANGTSSLSISRKRSTIARLPSRKSVQRLAQIWKIHETDAAELLSDFELAQTTITPSHGHHITPSHGHNITMRKTRQDEDKPKPDGNLDPLTKDFNELREQFKKEGLFDPSYAHVAYRIVLIKSAVP